MNTDEVPVGHARPRSWRRVTVVPAFAVGGVAIALAMVKRLASAGLASQAGLPLVEEEVLATTGLAKSLDPSGLRPCELPGPSVVGTETPIKAWPVSPSLGSAKTMEVMTTEIGPSPCFGPIIGLHAA